MAEELAWGWDIGGAHLKVAVAQPDGRLVHVEQIASPLWRGLDRLHLAIDAIRGLRPHEGSRHAITMTGELADIFENRKVGVASIVEAMRARLPRGDLRVYCEGRGLIACAETAGNEPRIASANWLVSAHWVARRLVNALLIDIGSTTSDFVLIEDGRVCYLGKTDGERLASGELVYTGLVRTPVMAVADRVPWGGRWQGIAAEHFATMADVYRLLGRLPPDADLMPTADGAGKTRLDSARRLARMLGRDVEEATLDEWTQVATHFAERQLRQLDAAVDGVLGRRAATVVGAGCGRELAEQIAAARGLPYRDFAELMDVPPELADLAARCAPAAALACLAWT